jgi:hypothetical protein
VAQRRIRTTDPQYKRHGNQHPRSRAQPVLLLCPSKRCPIGYTIEDTSGTADPGRSMAWHCQRETRAVTLALFPRNRTSATSPITKISRIADGQIGEAWVHLDTLSLYSQFGILRAPGGARTVQRQRRRPVPAYFLISATCRHNPISDSRWRQQCYQRREGSHLGRVPLVFASQSTCLGSDGFPLRLEPSNAGTAPALPEPRHRARRTCCHPTGWSDVQVCP